MLESIVNHPLCVLGLDCSRRQSFLQSLSESIGEQGVFAPPLRRRWRLQPQHPVFLVYIGLADFERVFLIPIHFEA